MRDSLANSWSDARIVSWGGGVGWCWGPRSLYMRKVNESGKAIASLAYLRRKKIGLAQSLWKVGSSPLRIATPLCQTHALRAGSGVVLLTQQYGAGWETWKRWTQTLPRKLRQKAMIQNLNSSWSVWNVLVALGQMLQMAILQIKTQSVELHTTPRKHSCPWHSCYDRSPSFLTGSESCFYKNGKERDNWWGTESFWWLAAGKGRADLVSRGSQADEMG